MLTNLINDLLDIAKMDSLNFKFNNQYFDMNELLLRALETFKYIADQKFIKIDI